jgi:Resolvase, N terminal domain/Recombinase
VRPVQDAILRELKPGDTLTVWKLDRLGRSAADLEDRKTVVPEEAARLHEAAEHASAGGSLGQLAVAWTAAKVPTWSGKGRWRATSVRRMLLNPDLVPAVFDADTHAALVRLFAPARARQQLGAPAKHLGSGILKCRCGGSILAVPSVESSTLSSLAGARSR